MLISIIIPVAKSQYLVKGIDSIINQTYSNWEIIIIDDHLDPNVKSVVSRFLDSGKIKYFAPPYNLGNGDPTKTWNFGLQYAKGKFAVLMGDDDYLSTNYLEKMVNLAVKYPNSNIFRARLAIIDRDDKIFEYGIGLPESEQWDELMYVRNIYARRQSTSEIMFNLDQIKKIGGFVSFPFAWASDDATWLCLSKTSGIYSTNEAFAFFRRHETALSGKLNIVQIEALEKLFIDWSHRFIEKNYDEAFNKINKQVLHHSVDYRLIRVRNAKPLSLYKHFKMVVKTMLNQMFDFLKVN